MGDIASRVKKVLAEELGIPDGEVTEEKRLVDDLGCDSLDKIELVMCVEDEFEIEVFDAFYDGLATVQDVINYVQKNVQNPA